MILLLTLLAFGEPKIAWQLGMCHGEGRGTICKSIGEPMDRDMCMTLRSSMLRHVSGQRIHCARVLLDEG